MEGVGYHFAPMDSLVLPNLAIRMLFPVLMTWDFFLCDFSPFHVLPVLHILWHAWPYTLSGGPNALYRHAGEMTYIGHT